MKEKIFEFIFCLLCIISMIFIFNHNNEVATIILEAINLFFTKVFVSLFPMFILNDLLINLGFPYYFYYLFNKLFKTIFKTSGLCAYVFIMSLISGTPSNAYILKNLVLENKLKKVSNKAIRALLETVHKINLSLKSIERYVTKLIKKNEYIPI